MTATLPPRTASGGQRPTETQRMCVAAGPKPRTDQSVLETQPRDVGAAPDLSAPAMLATKPNGGTSALADPFLNLAADVLDDLEAVRIANENRLRQLTRDETDKDGGERGFGLTLDHPDVARLAALVEELKKAEHHAELNLRRLLRQHPLGEWVKQARGVGEKQGARLLAAIGDPYWNTLHNRPRLLSELWSYCGYGDAEKQVRRRGVKVNWSPTARMRAHLVAVSIVISGGPYRKVYDKTRAQYKDALHDRPCVRCGPSGQPAPAGSPLSGKHQQARAERAVAKAVLKDLWLEAKRLHELSGDHASHETQALRVAGALSPSTGQPPSGTQPLLAGGGPSTQDSSTGRPTSGTQCLHAGGGP